MPVAAPLPPPPPRIELLTVTKSIAGVAEVNGKGCESGAPVSITVNGNPVAKAVADDTGDFQTTFSTGTTPAGKHSVQAICGPTLSALLDIVLVSEVGTPGPAVIMILLIALTFGWLLLRGRSTSAPKESAL